MWALRAASRHDLNVRSAFVHMLGDALGSAAIVAGGVVMSLHRLAASGPGPVYPDRRC